MVPSLLCDMYRFLVLWKYCLQRVGALSRKHANSTRLMDVSIACFNIFLVRLKIQEDIEHVSARLSDILEGMFDDATVCRCDW